MPRPSIVEQFEDGLKRLRAAVGTLEDAMALVLQTARTPDLRDGLSSGHAGPAGESEDGDVVLTSVEAAAIRRDPNEHERKQALEVLATTLGADKLLGRAAELALVLQDRIPVELREVAEVTCVDDRCENLRGEGWDDRHPNGVAGRCKPCYDRRQRARRDG